MDKNRCFFTVFGCKTLLTFPKNKDSNLMINDMAAPHVLVRHNDEKFN